VVVILGQARRAVGVDALEERPERCFHVLLLQHGRHRNDHRELLQRPLVVVQHVDRGAVPVPHQHDLRRIVEQVGVGFADEKAAERLRVAGKNEYRPTAIAVFMNRFSWIACLAETQQV
jgi:hypothetical protein